MMLSALENMKASGDLKQMQVLTKEFSDQMNVFMKQLKESGHARPVTPAYPQVTRAFQQTIDDISFYDQNKNIKKVLDTRATEMQAAIDKANR